MKRPDSDVIRRLLKSGALNGKVLSAGYNGRHGWSLDKVLGLPYFYLSYKKMEEFDFTTSDDFPDATDGTLLGNPVKVIEKKHNGVDVVRSYAPSAEFVYDEFVLSAKTDIQLTFPTALSRRRLSIIGASCRRLTTEQIALMLLHCLSNIQKRPDRF